MCGSGATCAPPAWPPATPNYLSLTHRLDVWERSYLCPTCLTPSYPDFSLLMLKYFMQLAVGITSGQLASSKNLNPIHYTVPKNIKPVWQEELTAGKPHQLRVQTEPNDFNLIGKNGNWFLFTLPCEKSLSLKPKMPTGYGTWKKAGYPAEVCSKLVRKNMRIWTTKMLCRNIFTWIKRSRLHLHSSFHSSLIYSADRISDKIRILCI